MQSQSYCMQKKQNVARTKQQRVNTNTTTIWLLVDGNETYHNDNNNTVKESKNTRWYSTMWTWKENERRMTKIMTNIDCKWKVDKSSTWTIVMRYRKWKVVDYGATRQEVDLVGQLDVASSQWVVVHGNLVPHPLAQLVHPPP